MIYNGIFQGQWKLWDYWKTERQILLYIYLWICFLMPCHPNTCINLTFKWWINHNIHYSISWVYYPIFIAMEYPFVLSAYEIKLTLSSPASLIPLTPSSLFPPPSRLWLSILSPNISLLFTSFCSVHQTQTTQRLWCCTAFSDYMFPSCCPP